MPGLEDLYREIILDHYKNPRNRGELETPPATVAEGHNPLCGDEITVYVLIDDGRVSEVRTAGQGCSISQSSASMMTQAMTMLTQAMTMMTPATMTPATMTPATTRASRSS